MGSACEEIQALSCDPPMPWMEWYNSLDKPSWTPALATIGLIWNILYPIIAVSFGFVFVQAIRRKVPWPVALPFAINLVVNLVFTPIELGLRNLLLASLDILVVWGTIIWMAVVVWRQYRCLLRLGVHRHRAVTFDHGDELVKDDMLRVIITAQGGSQTMPTHRKVIQFHGGPLDGHRQDISERKKALPTLLHLEISVNTFHNLAKKPLMPDALPSSIAVYELRMANGEDRYCFVAAKKPSQKPAAGR